MKRIKLKLSVLWLSVSTATCIYFTNVIKYPTVESIEDIIGMFLIFFVPAFFVIYFLVPEKNRKRLMVALFCVLMTVNIIYFYCSISTRSLYPISVSETKDYRYYLNFDEVSENSEFIKEVFPKKIPENATDVEYHYKAYLNSNSMFVQAYWKLPEKEYELEKTRVKSMSETKLKYDSEEYYYIDAADEYCHICFDNENYSVVYFADVNECCNWQNISWIKTEWNTADGSMIEKN